MSSILKYEMFVYCFRYILCYQLPLQMANVIITTNLTPSQLSLDIKTKGA